MSILEFERLTLPVVLLLFVMSGCTSGSDANQTRSRQNGDAAHEIVVVTVNAHQFELEANRLRTLAGALGRTLADRAPDVILLQEIEAGGVVALARLLGAVFPGEDFEPTGPQGRHVKSKAIVNVSANDVFEFRVWTDACDERNRYLALRLVERTDESHFTVAGVHIPWDAGSVCRVRNASLIKQTVDDWDGAATVVGGDFNQRAVEELRECDVAETSDPLPWWKEMTSDEGSGAFSDAVKIDAQRSGESVGEYWTYEGIGPTTLCNGAEEFRRNRIDYIFVRGADVLDAGADDPGWAGEDPGTYRCRVKTACRYSDHRFVWARLGI
ncbi:MAG: endonuclease/exonuclease/phosphatase family protein [Actinomycetota bacterium]